MNDTSEPAFPVVANNWHRPGISIRDYFAAKALQACFVDDTNVHGTARLAYRIADAMLEQQAIEQAEKQEPVDWDLSNSATVERARKVVKLITERNQNAWSETDRETVHAINALINFAVMQFHRANTAPREWVGLRDEDLPQGETYDFDRGVRWAERYLKEKNHDTF
jgi:hypothetical protein